MLAFPGILLAMSLVAILGTSLFNLMLAVGIAASRSTPGWCAGTVFRARETEYVTAARVSGAPTDRIMLRHILPNVLPPVIVLATLGIAGAIILGSTLSFLGLGIKPPTPEWGNMLSDGRSHDAPLLVGLVLPRAGHHADRAGYQPPGRRSARRARPPASTIAKRSPWCFPTLAIRFSDSRTPPCSGSTRSSRRNRRRQPRGRPAGHQRLVVSQYVETLGPDAFGWYADAADRFTELKHLAGHLPNSDRRIYYGEVVDSAIEFINWRTTGFDFQEQIERFLHVPAKPASEKSSTGFAGKCERFSTISAMRASSRSIPVLGIASACLPMSHRHPDERYPKPGTARRRYDDSGRRVDGMKVESSRGSRITRRAIFLTRTSGSTSTRSSP